jgi:DNA-binding response OmpR family regulator
MNCSTACDDTLEAIADGATMRRPAVARCRCQQVVCVGRRAMNALTGATTSRDQQLALPVTDRELLGVFLRHAGQIISRDRLAAILGLNAHALDHHVQTLREALKSVGSPYLPYTVEGIGYVLWNGELAARGHLER